MSVILDALRRSEAERRRQRGPELHALVAPRTPARRTRPLLLGLGIGFGVAAVLAAAWWWRGTPPPAPPDDPPPPPTAASPTAAAASRPAAMPAVDSLALGRELDAPPPAPAAASAPLEAAAPEPVPPRAAPALPAPAPAPAVQAASPAPTATRLDALDAGLRAQLPPLRLSMHVYDADPARRFAIVDGQRRREGDVLAPGLLLLAIERDGLRLDWQGRALRIPR